MPERADTTGRVPRRARGPTGHSRRIGVGLGALVLGLVCAGAAPVPAAGAAAERTAPGPPQTTDAARPTGPLSGPAARRDVEETQGPFVLDGQDFTVVLRYKALPGGSEAEARALVSLQIRDAAGAVQFEESYPYALGDGGFSASCTAGVRLLQGSNGCGLLIESACLPSAPLAGGPWRIVGVVAGRLAPVGKPLVAQGECGPFLPGAVRRTGELTQILPDVLDLRVWTGYFFASVPVRICLLYTSPSPRD